MFKEEFGNGKIIVKGRSKFLNCEKKNSFLFDGYTYFDYQTDVKNIKTLQFCLKIFTKKGDIVKFLKGEEENFRFSIKDNCIYSNGKKFPLKTNLEPGKIYKIILFLNKIYINGELDITFAQPDYVNFTKLYIGDNVKGIINNLYHYNFNLSDIEISVISSKLPENISYISFNNSLDTEENTDENTDEDEKNKIEYVFQNSRYNGILNENNFVKIKNKNIKSFSFWLKCNNYKKDANIIKNENYSFLEGDEKGDLKIKTNDKEINLKNILKYNNKFNYYCIIIEENKVKIFREKRVIKEIDISLNQEKLDFEIGKGFDGFISEFRGFDFVLLEKNIFDLYSKDYIKYFQFNTSRYYNFLRKDFIFRDYVIVDNNMLFFIVGYFGNSARNTMRSEIHTKKTRIDKNIGDTVFSTFYGDVITDEVRYIAVKSIFEENWKDERKLDFSHGIQTGRKWKFVYTDGNEVGMGQNSRYGFHITYCKNNVYNWKTNANFMRMNDNNPSISSLAFSEEGTFRLAASNDGELGIAYNRTNFGHNDYLSAGFGRDDGNSFFFDSNKSNKSGSSHGGVQIESPVFVLISPNLKELYNV